MLVGFRNFHLFHCHFDSTNNLHSSNCICSGIHLRFECTHVTTFLFAIYYASDSIGFGSFNWVFCVVDIRLFNLVGWATEMKNGGDRRDERNYYLKNKKKNVAFFWKINWEWAVNFKYFKFQSLGIQSNCYAWHMIHYLISLTLNLVPLFFSFFLIANQWKCLKLFSTICQ